jgi:hypothetical protein
MSNRLCRIAIVGSYNPARAEELNLKNVELAPMAGEQLGRALAGKGFHIIVYASYPHLLEVDVVRGYAQAMHDKPHCIEMHYPQRMEPPSFPDLLSGDLRILPQPDYNDNWEVSFYQSIRDVDGMLLLGGGPSALIAGIVAISHDKPVVACADFGGEAKKVWNALSNRDVLATVEEKRMMGRPWTDTSAELMIDILEAQIKRARAMQAARNKSLSRSQGQRDRVQYLVAMFCFLLLGLIVYGGSLGNATLTNQYWPVLMLVSATCTGAAGAMTSALLDERGGKKPQAIWETAGLGAVAGFAASGLFVLAQVLASPTSSPDNTQTLLYERLLLFTVIIGLIAGLTFESVFKRLRDIDVVHKQGIDAGGASGGSEGG